MTFQNCKIGIKKDKQTKCKLPELLLICKILNTLPEEYFSFKSSWMLTSKAHRTIENFTNQLCAFESTLVNKNAVSNLLEFLITKSLEKEKH